jgi:GAF domain-containing protein/sugar diacid utilization regulator
VDFEDEPIDSKILAVLELLADEAPPARFENLLHGTPAVQARHDESRRLERAVRIALDIRATAEERRRRETALAALVDTAQDISGYQELTACLHVVTRHARRLIGFDMAYVSLRSPNGRSYVHHSDGDTTALNRGLEMGRGLGLGEMAQDRNAPFWTSDYLTDSRFPHSETIDEVVKAEGLHAILAVPMTKDDRLVGALYGACRVIRHFSPDEVSLLCSLADLSASAVETTRRIDQAQSALTRATAENSRVREALAQSRALAEVQTTLSRMCLTGEALQDIVQVAAAALGGDLVVRNAAGKALAGTGDISKIDMSAMIRAMVDSHATASTVEMADGLWAAHVTTGEDGQWILICGSPSPLGEEGQSLLYFTAQIIAQALLLRHDFAVAAGPVRDGYLNDLLSGGSSTPRHLAERAHRLGLDPTADHVMIVLCPEEDKQGEAAIWASSYAYRHAGLKTVRDNCLVLFLPGSDASAAARRAADDLSSLLGQAVSAGAAGPVRNLASADTAHQEAVRCLETLVALGGTGAAAASDLGFLGLLLSKDHDVDAFIASAVGPVIEYDSQHSTELAHTLDAYFTSGGSPSRAGQDLHVHTNTVARRLDRISELLGPDWRQPPIALEIQLALRLRKTRWTVHRPVARPDLPDPDVLPAGKDGGTPSHRGWSEQPRRGRRRPA